MPSFSGSQSYKDKSFDAKFLIHKETPLLPAVAIGFRDLAGTGVFSSEYVVASKRMSNIDFTVGLGWGAYSDHGFRNPLIDLKDDFAFRDVSDNVTQGGEFSPGRYFSGPMGVFGGIEIPLPNLNGLKLKIEYDGTDYKEEGFPFGRNSFQRPYNEALSLLSEVIDIYRGR